MINEEFVISTIIIVRQEKGLKSYNQKMITNWKMQ